MHVIRNSNPPLIEWDDQSFISGVADMDATHRQFIDLLNRLDNTVNSEFAALFTRLVEHTQAHFADEEARMLASGFPGVADHTSEHRRVLGELAQIKKQVDKGLISFGRCYVREGLPGWFRLHVATMDGALAAHLKRHGEAAGK